MINLTSTGGTLKAKIVTPGTTTTHNSTGSTAGTGSEPDRVLHKSSANDANGGTYTFTVQSTLYSFPEEPPFQFAQGQLEFYVKPSGGSWTLIGTANVFHTTGTTGLVSVSDTVTKTYANAIGQHSDQEFGVSLANPSSGEHIDGFSVSYQSTSQSNVASATPNGEACKVTILPKNA